MNAYVVPALSNILILGGTDNMGIFGSNKTNSEIDAIVFDESPDAIESTDFEPISVSKTTSAKYGINQATKLVRSFQKHNISSNVIAGIMKQTLASVEIHFTDIIDDAKRKETAVQSESEKKDKQIEEATRKCEALKEEKTKLQQILKETITVREFLLQAMDKSQASAESEQKSVAQSSDKLEQPNLEKAEAKPEQPAAVQAVNKEDLHPTDTQQIEPLRSNT